MSEAKHSPLLLTMRRNLMQLPKDELVDELIGALLEIASPKASISLHHELVAALENVRAAIMEDTTALSDTLWLPERISKNETVVDYIDAVLKKAK